MNHIEEIAQSAVVRAALHTLTTPVEAVIETAVAIQQIAAPTFAEAERAAFIAAGFRAIGLPDVFEDELHNVYGRYPAQTSSQQPPVILSAHSDTVFPPETDLTLRRSGPYISGPGIGDNSMGVAGLLHLAQTFVRHQIKLPSDVWFVANVGEEGLGNLVGMRAVVDRLGQEAVYIVIEGGLFGQIAHQAIGVQQCYEHFGIQ